MSARPAKGADPVTALMERPTGQVTLRSTSAPGRLVLEKRVLERVAAQAASELGQVGGVSGAFLGFGSHADLTARPATNVELVGTTATVGVDATVTYPTPIRQAADQLRRHLMTRVQELTGVQVTRVDIAITSLQPASSTGQRELL